VPGKRKRGCQRGGPASLIRKIARKEKMIREYERIATTSSGSGDRDRSMRAYFLKRAADFRKQKKKLEDELRRLLGS
jgi:hypothetical protein